MPDEEIDYKRLYEAEKAKNERLSIENTSFKMPGRVKLFYSLNKNMNDLADLLNSVDMTKIDLDDPKAKAIERLKIIWSSVGSLAPILETIGGMAGITGDEKSDMENRVPFIETVAETRR